MEWQPGNYTQGGRHRHDWHYMIFFLSTRVKMDIYLIMSSGLVCFCLVLGWCCAVIPRRAGKVPNLWRPQEEAVRFSQNHRPTVGDFGHQQQSTVGSGGWWSVFPKYNPSPSQLNADPWYRNSVSFTLNAVSSLITRWCIMTHAEEAQAIGTVCSGLSIWPLGAIWLQRWVRCVSVDYTLSFSFFLFTVYRFRPTFNFWAGSNN